ncbi:Stk1 family PASTA domain-containing Ser/Thr kinase [Bacillus suaedae]|uniref:Serine/threonine-protein kinase PrkC n=1 Tax=Halalkalibacter suaedae TaxID=2822140 RepID=A0A940WWU6_9BACI|nr:Stk1 family PASTA domain-containing Ser/Thr kinase [Bacillus suaedae]MBP3952082.1 Stk1 family PASTA domain-containing Ser/Thr kinase [Bacillus suaedae]
MIGQRINGRYQILGTIGGGGMANVYKAHDVILDRHVAVKVLQPQFSDDEQFIKRFRREAQAATSLAHPNVVNIYDVGEEESTYYIVMEYIEGQTLKELIQSRGPLPVEEAIDYMEQMLSALAHAHANHLIHRDIKPHNILVRHDGVLKVTDFGIARAISAATITHTNSVMGSVHYLSPEQARGGHITYKSDIYSLGIVFYEMITGRLPFSGDTAVSIAIKHLQTDIPSVKKTMPNIPQSIENIIKKATEKDANNRYESIQEMEEDVATALNPDRINEAPYVQEIDLDATKAIPIIKNDATPDLEKTVEMPVQHSKTPPPSQETSADKKDKGKRKKKWLIPLFVLAFVFGAFIVAIAILPGLFQVEEVEVPDLSELSYEEAEELLTEASLVPIREDVNDENIPKDQVVRQNPEPGTKVKENAEVTVFVSLGKKEVEIEDYIGVSIDRAEALLEGKGFTVRREERETNDENPGIVLDQDPKEGTLVIPEDTTVTLTYSVEAPVSLQNLVGLQQNAVQEYLNEVGLQGNYEEEYSSSIEKGRVIRQDPQAFSTLSKGDQVKIVISLGPEPQPEPEPEPEPEEEQTKLISQSYKIVVEDEDVAAGNQFDVKIIYRDATTEGEDQTYLEETITETETFRIQLRVSPSQPGSYDVYVDNEIVERSQTFQY